jgi:hypothetical protein
MMGLAVGIRIRSDLTSFLRDFENEAAQQAWGAVNRAGMRVKNDVRQRTVSRLGRSRSAVGGQSVERMVRQRTYPTTQKSLGARAFVYIPWRLAEVFFGDSDTLIVPKNGRFLAIPTQAAEQVGLAGRGERRSGSGFGAGNQARGSQVSKAIERFRDRWRIFPGAHGEFVFAVQPTKGGKWTVLFVLVPRARVKPVFPLSKMESIYLGWLQQELGNAFRMAG